MIIALTQLKGGIGRSTISILIADELVRRGRKVVCIDCDHPQFSLASWCAQRTDQPVVLCRTTTEVKRAVAQAAATGADIVIDTAPRIEPGTPARQALMLCDIALVPSEASPMAMYALQDFDNLLQQARAARPELKAYVLRNKVVGSRKIEGEAVSALDELVTTPVLKTYLSFLSAYVKATDGTPLADIKGAKKAQCQVRSLVDEIEAIIGSKQDVNPTQETADQAKSD